MHAFPPERVDDEFAVDGRAREITDADVIARVRAAYHAPIQTADEVLLEFDIERALLATYGPRPSWPPVYTRWP